MNEILAKLFTNLGQKLAITLLVGTAAVTTGAAVIKIANGQREDDSKKVQSTPKVNEDNTSKPIPTTKPKIVSTPNPTTIPTAIKTPTPSKTTVAIDTSNKCIVTLFGKLYDVTNLRSSHSGGDIFSCGTDMTTTYQGKHGTNMSRMSAYAYDPNSPTSVVISTPTKTKSNYDEDEENEREDKRNEDRYIDNDEDNDEDSD